MRDGLPDAVFAEDEIVPLQVADNASRIFLQDQRIDCYQIDIDLNDLFRSCGRRWLSRRPAGCHGALPCLRTRGWEKIDTGDKAETDQNQGCILCATRTKNGSREGES